MSGQLYSEFLRQVADEISELEQDIKRLNHSLSLNYSLSDVPELVRREGASLVKLIDEYYWTGMPRGHAAPARDELAKWLRWMPVG